MIVHVVTESFTLAGKDYRVGDELPADVDLLSSDNKHRVVKVERPDPKKVSEK